MLIIDLFLRISSRISIQFLFSNRSEYGVIVLFTSPSDYVCVLDVGMFELSLRISNGRDPVSFKPGYGIVSFVCTNNLSPLP